MKPKINKRVTKDYKNKLSGIPDWRKYKLLGPLLDTDKDIESRQNRPHHNEIPDWRKCKLLGSLLDTDKDIEK